MSTAVKLLPLALALATVARLSAEVSQQPRIVGKCFTVHGRLSVCNGTPPVRIWRVGTHRVLGIWGEDPENPKLPDNLARVFQPDPTTAVYGDFVVCPMTKYRRGHMQMVIIQSARNLTVRRDSLRR